MIAVLKMGHPERFIGVVVLIGVALLVFWFVTAPAAMAVERIAAGTGSGPIAEIFSGAFRWYASPMPYCAKIPALRCLNDSLEDKWCSILDAPETTP